MAVRTGLQYIVDTLELLVQDTNNNDLSPDDYQNILDLQSIPVIQHRLIPLDKDGEYWRSATGFWESDSNAPTLKDYSGNIIAHTADYTNGIFTLDTPNTDQIYLWNGRTYDIYTAAYLTCNILVAKIKGEYSISVSEGSFSRFDRVETLEKLSMMYHSMGNTFSMQISDYDYTSTIYDRSTDYRGL